MNTLDFLRATLPEEGTHYLVLMRAGKNGMPHFPYSSLEAMAVAIAKADADPTLTVYHATSSYHEPFVMNGEKKQYRVPQNCAMAKAFWIDLDVGIKKDAEGKGYATKQLAVTALRQFCKTANFPAPMLVSSGNGIHAYWPLTTAIDRDSWVAMATQFKSILKHFGVLADTSRTSDFASILRPPGSHNKKDPNNHKLVKVLSTAPALIAPEAFMAALSNSVSNYEVDCEWVPPRRLPSDENLNDDLTVHVPAIAYPDAPADAEIVVDRCQQARLFKETGCTDEPTWHAMIPVIRLCTNGEAKVHEFSSASNQYNAAETQRKIDACIDKPTTCAHIRSCNPFGCEGCTQTVTTPLELGRVQPEAIVQAQDALTHTQEHFALITLGGAVGMVDKISLRQRQTTCAFGALVVQKRDTGQLLISRLLAKGFPGVDVRATLAKFLQSPQTALYDGVDFTPEAGRPGALNLWVGPTLTPCAGTWPVLHDFLFTIICAGDQLIYDYLIRYIAHALQKPQEKPGVMVTLIGGQGSGKGTLFALITEIWRATTLMTSRISDIVGDFNDALEGSMWVLLDEAFFAGSRRDADALKSTNTAEQLRINPKGQPARTIPSVHRFMMATNHPHAANREHDDRRDLTLRVSDSRKGDRAYWVRAYAAIKTEAPAMMHDLQNLDLAGFNVRAKPDTNELTTQKLRSLPPPEAYWHECLYTGSINGSNEWPPFIGTEALCNGAKEFAKGGRSFSTLTTDAMVAVIRKLCPQITRAQRSIGLRRIRGLDLPSLEDCRAAFAHYIGGKVEW